MRKRNSIFTLWGLGRGVSMRIAGVMVASISVVFATHSSSIADTAACETAKSLSGYDVYGPGGHEMVAVAATSVPSGVTLGQSMSCQIPDLSRGGTKTKYYIFLKNKQCLYAVANGPRVCNNNGRLVEKEDPGRECNNGNEITDDDAHILNRHQWSTDNEGFTCLTPINKQANAAARRSEADIINAECNEKTCTKKIPHLAPKGWGCVTAKQPDGTFTASCSATKCQNGYEPSADHTQCVLKGSTANTKSASVTTSSSSSCLDRLEIGKPETPCKAGYTYKVCAVPSRNLSGECSGTNMLPTNATAAECSSAGRNGYSICLATDCVEGYVPTGGLCKKSSSSSSTPQQPTPPTPPQTPPTPSQGNPQNKICGTTIFQGTAEGQSDIVDYIIGNVEITVKGTAGSSTNCNSDKDGVFDCGAISMENALYTVVFKKEGFLEKSVSVGLFSTLNCPKIILEKDPNYTQPPQGEEQIIITQPEVDLGNRAQSMCEKSGGEFKGGTCICDRSNSLEQTTVKDTNDNNKEITICKCIAGYRRDTGNYDGKCIDAREYEEHEELDTAKMREAAESIYKDEYNNEQSWANKALTSGTTLATGEGAMAAAQAYAEQKADEAAERDMTAYLETFKCEYGGGKTYKGGTEDIFLPGGNELTKYYQEYKDLADKVKEHKTALGLRPGIETEVLYQRAQTGLYQYANTGITGGAYTSLSRALLDPDSEDATDWNQQKADTAAQLKKGKETFMVGIIAGVLGNYLINGNRQRQELKEEYKKVQTRLENEHPEVFTPDGVPPTPEPEITVIPSEETTIVAPDVAEQVQGFSHPIYGTGFEFAKYKLNRKGEALLNDYIREINNMLNNDPRFSKAEVEIRTFGHTDKAPVSKNNREYKTNTELSQLRAKTVLDYLKDNFHNDRVHFGTSGGDGEQWCNKNPSKTPAECRHVEIILRDITPGTQYL